MKNNLKYYQRYDLSDIEKFNLHNLSHDLLMYNPICLDHHMITRIQYSSHYLRSVYFLFHDYYQEHFSLFKKSIYDVYYTQIRRYIGGIHPLLLF